MIKNMIIDEKYWDLLRQVYRDNKCPRDRICTNESAARGFAAELSRRAGFGFEPESVKATLMYLQKNKETTGGLPLIGRSPEGPVFLN